MHRLWDSESIKTLSRHKFSSELLIRNGDYFSKLKNMDQDHLSLVLLFAPLITHEGAYWSCPEPSWHPKLITYNNPHLSNTACFWRGLSQRNSLCWQVPKILQQGTNFKLHFCGRWKKSGGTLKKNTRHIQSSISSISVCNLLNPVMAFLQLASLVRVFCFIHFPFHTTPNTLNIGVLSQRCHDKQLLIRETPFYYILGVTELYALMCFSFNCLHFNHLPVHCKWKLKS